MLADGKKISEPSQLLTELENMNEKIFRTHVSDIHNDFADWVEDVFGERMLANELRVADNNMELMDSLRRYLNKPQEKAQKESVEVVEEQQNISEVIEEAAADSIPEVSPSVDYHEDAAPVIENEVHEASEVSENPLTVEAASIIQEDNIVVENPEDAPVVELGSETVNKESQDLSDESQLLQASSSLTVAAELPALGINLPGPKYGISKTANPFVLQVMMMYRYLLMILTLGRFKLEPVQEKQDLTPKITTQVEIN